MVVPNLLSARHLFTARDGIPILRDVSLTVTAGEAVAIVGGNGSGKSTLIQTCLGLIGHQSGEVRLFGEALPKFKQWFRIGYVPQLGGLSVSNASVAEVVAMGRLSRRKPFQWLGAEDRERVAHALARVDLVERSNWPFVQLSGGQQQRARIARALVSDPELLVMDEPLAGVDLHSQAELAELLQALRGDGLGMAIVLHELGPMTSVIDREVRLCDGRVVADDPPSGSCDAAEPEAVQILGGPSV